MNNMDKNSTLYKYLYGSYGDSNNKVYDFGATIDMGPTTAEELLEMSHYCFCSGSTPGPTPEPEPVENVLDFNIIFDNAYKMQTISDFPITSSITATINYTFNTVDKTKIIILSANQNLWINDLELELGVIDNVVVSLDITSDDDYIYSSNIITNEDGVVYYGIKLNKLGNITIDDVNTFNNISFYYGTYPIEFTFNPVLIDGLNDLPDSEINNIINDNFYDMYILYKSTISSITILDELNIPATNFIDNGDIVINGVEMKILKSTNTSQNNIIDSTEAPGLDVKIKYKISN